MNYILTESQINIISELDRDWRTKMFESQYPELKERLVPAIVKMCESYSQDGNVINVYNKNDKRLLYYKKYNDGGELFYNRELNSIFESHLPHPTWYVHGDYIMSDAFESMFPGLTVTSVRSANMT